MSQKILIVDDNPEILELLGRKLSMEGYTVANVSKGLEVLDKAKEFRPEFILMDIVLEDIDGAEAVRQLQTDVLTQDIPVIFLSGIVVNNGDGQSSGIKVGERHYPALGKPFAFKELMDKIKAIR